jgi:hypothetical protein
MILCRNESLQVPVLWNGGYADGFKQGGNLPQTAGEGERRHTEPCPSCPDHPKTKYPDGIWEVTTWAQASG